MNNKIWMVGGLLVAVCGTALAQPAIEWQQRYEVGQYVAYRYPLQKPDGGYLLAGGALSEDWEDFAGLVVSTDPDGEAIWSRSYGGDEEDGFCEAIPWGEGYLLVGRSASFDDRNREKTWLVLVDEDGEITWSQTFGEENFNYYTRDIELNQDGGISVSGIRSDGHRSFAFLQKFTPDLGLAWERTYGGPRVMEEDGLHVELAEGGFIIAGNVADWDGNGRDDGVLIKIDADGEVLWQQSYGNEQVQHFANVMESAESEIVTVGYSFTDDIAGWVLFINQEGEIISENFYGDFENTHLTDCQQLEDGGFIFGGSYDWAPHITRVDADHQVLWTMNPEIPIDYEWTHITLTNDGGYAVGYTYLVDYWNEEYEFGLAKIAPDPRRGFPIWEDEVPDPQVREDQPLNVDFNWFLDHVEDFNNGPDDLDLRAIGSEHLGVEIADRTISISSDSSWWGEETITISAIDPDGHTVSTDFTVVVAAVNDPPLPFGLLSPENGVGLLGNQTAISFQWELSGQEPMELDTSIYRLKLWKEDLEVVIDSITADHILIRDLAEIRNRLGIDLRRTEVQWSVTAFDSGDETLCDTTFTLIFNADASTGMEVGFPPYRFELVSVAPNPFNSATNISFTLDRTAEAKLAVYDLSGHEVMLLGSGNYASGLNRLVWSAEDLPAGVYILRLSDASGRARTMKVALIR